MISEIGKQAAEAALKSVESLSPKIPSENPNLNQSLAEKLNPTLSGLEPLRNGDLNQELGQKLSESPVEEITSENQIPKEENFVQKDLDPEIGRLGRGYLEDIKSKASGPFENRSDFESWNRSDVDTKSNRLDFNLNKRNLIANWENKYGQDWPRYQEDFYDEKTGTKIRKAGDLHDAHHIQKLEFGGENTADNLVPIHARDHYDHRGVHSSDSPLSLLEKYLKS